MNHPTPEALKGETIEKLQRRYEEDGENACDLIAEAFSAGREAGIGEAKKSVEKYIGVTACVCSAHQSCVWSCDKCAVYLARCEALDVALAAIDNLTK